MPDTQALTLFSLEAELVALADTVEMTPDEQQAEILQVIAKTTETAVAKRDAVANFLLYLDHQLEGVDREIKRLEDLKSRWKSGKERLSKYVADIIATFVEQPKRGNKKLDGRLHVLTIAQNPPSVELLGAVPDEYCDVTVRLPGTTFRILVDTLTSYGSSDLVKALFDRREVLPRKADIKRAIEQGTAVPGAHLRDGSMRLVVR